MKGLFAVVLYLVVSLISGLGVVSAAQENCSGGSQCHDSGGSLTPSEKSAVAFFKHMGITPSAVTCYNSVNCDVRVLGTVFNLFDDHLVRDLGLYNWRIERSYLVDRGRTMEPTPDISAVADGCDVESSCGESAKEMQALERKAMDYADRMISKPSGATCYKWDTCYVVVDNVLFQLGCSPDDNRSKTCLLLWKWEMEGRK